MSHQARAWAERQKTGSVARKAVLMKIADCYTKDHGCFPKQTTIADAVELSVRSVQRIIEQLEEGTFIRRIKHGIDKNGKQLPDEYILLAPSEALEVPENRLQDYLENGARRRRTQKHGDKLSPDTVSPDSVSPGKPVKPGDNHDRPTRHPRQTHATTVSPAYELSSEQVINKEAAASSSDAENGGQAASGLTVTVVSPEKNASGGLNGGLREEPIKNPVNIPAKGQRAWWDEQLAILSRRIGAAQFRAFIRPLVLDAVDAEQVRLRAPDTFVRDHVRNNFEDVIERACGRRVELILARPAAPVDVQRQQAGRAVLPPGDRE